ncbi:MAG: iron-sulfur cluster assembly scaffold protein [Desulfobacteraceae bacterium]|nr:iron-sulfur cluster assembly scaffold protein [Desulfobacteraceae bacterium]
MTEDIYQDPIIRLSKQREHDGFLDSPDIRGTADNPLCGDRVTVELDISDGIIRHMKYQVRGCLLTRASCANLAGMIEGVDISGIHRLRNEFNRALSSQGSDRHEFPPPVAVFSPVAPHKSRHSCLLLPYDAVIDAMDAQVSAD